MIEKLLEIQKILLKYLQMKPDSITATLLLLMTAALIKAKDLF